jgi:hypothetical protein
MAKSGMEMLGGMIPGMGAMKQAAEIMKHLPLDKIEQGARDLAEDWKSVRAQLDRIEANGVETNERLANLIRLLSSGRNGTSDDPGSGPGPSGATDSGYPIPLFENCSIGGGK